MNHATGIEYSERGYFQDKDMVEYVQREDVGSDGGGTSSRADSAWDGNWVMMHSMSTWLP